MGLSSIGLKYLLEGTKSAYGKIRQLNITNNNIDSSGISFLNKFLKGKNSIEKIFIHRIIFIITVLLFFIQQIIRLVIMDLSYF